MYVQWDFNFAVFRTNNNILWTDVNKGVLYKKGGFFAKKNSVEQFLHHVKGLCTLTLKNIGTQSVQELFFCDSIRRTVYSNDLVKFFWLRYTPRKKLGIYDVHTMLHR